MVGWGLTCSNGLVRTDDDDDDDIEADDDDDDEDDKVGWFPRLVRFYTEIHSNVEAYLRFFFGLGCQSLQH